MPRPNVLVIGAQKCGTTALHRLLTAHPRCSGGRIKETHFLVDEAPGDFGRWRLGLDWYDANYDDAEIRVDVSPSYAGWPLFGGVVDRAAQVVPDATIVYLVRDPVDRLASHWRHWVWRGYEDRPFEAAVLDPSPDNRYLIGSRYATQLRQWLDAYPAERVLALHQREVRDGAVRFWDHFGLAPPALNDVTANVSDDFTVPKGVARLLPDRMVAKLPRRLATRPVPRPDVSDALRERLQDELRDEAVRFEQLTGVRVADWA